MHKAIYEVIVNKGINKNLFDYIYSWGENLAFIPLEIIYSYHHTLQETPENMNLV